MAFLGDAVREIQMLSWLVPNEWATGIEVDTNRYISQYKLIYLYIVVDIANHRNTCLLVMLKYDQIAQ